MPAALPPGRIGIDERRLGDLLGFAERFAGLLAYYNIRNEWDGNCSELLQRDLSFVIAAIARREPAKIATTFARYLEAFDSAPDADTHKTVFDVAFSVFREIDEIYRATPLDTPIRTDATREIEGRLRAELGRLIAVYGGGVHEEFVNAAHSTSPGDDDFPFKDAEEVLREGFSSIWNVDGITMDTVPYTTGSNDLERFMNARAIVDGIHRRAFEGYVRLVTAASRHLASSLNHHSGHQPHVALLLAFIRIYGVLQTDLNRLTQKHLDFYYRRILRLRARPARPDAVHLLVELARHSQPHRIAAGTEVKAGKDDTGVERIYRIDEHFIANSANIASLKSIYIDEDAAAGGVFDAPQANSADGLGAQLDADAPSWRPFGEPQADLGAATSMRRSKVGWAIASPMFRLAEGNRTIELVFHVEGGGGLETLADEIDGRWFRIDLTGQSGWLLGPEVKAKVVGSGDAPTLTLELTLGEDVEAVVDHDQEIHATTYPTDWPVLRVRIAGSEELTPPRNVLRALREVTIGQVDVTVKVDGLRTLILQNDFGALDPSKAFMPFGSRPKRGSNFYVGSHEALTKPTTKIDVTLEWMGLPSVSFPDYYGGYASKLGVTTPMLKTVDFNADIWLVADGGWSRIGDAVPLFKASQSEVVPGELVVSESRAASSGNAPAQRYRSPATANAIRVNYQANRVNDGYVREYEAVEFVSQSYLQLDFLGTGPHQRKTLTFELALDSRPHADRPGAFEIGARNGFLRVELASPPEAFGHEVYTLAYTAAVILKTANSGDTTLEELREPYTPMLRSITLDYDAQETIVFGADAPSDAGQYFHLHPFGFREVTETKPSLLPPFEHESNANLELIEGALYVGLAGSQTGSRVSLLFQMAEGTENASKDPPAVVWSYLGQNRWRPLDDGVVADSTNGLLDSGVVTLAIPDDAGEDNTLLPGKVRWFRLSIDATDPYHFDAFPELLGVHAQAVRATFEDRGNDPRHVATPLPAGQISRLLRGDSAIKKLDQPYASFDGRMQEEPAAYYTRVSERLRHKQRAITVWDYERLVLEQFPELYRVKCLNHTSLDPPEEATEIAAGHVTVVVIPDLRNKTAGDRFQPRVSNDTREHIRGFLRRLNCPFAQLTIANPTYEAVKVTCNVAFHHGYPSSYYNGQLARDIDKLLAPWVFDEGLSIDFGGELHHSRVLKYVEDLPYVDFITDFALSVCDENGDVIVDNVTMVRASMSRSILTSNRVHEIGSTACGGTQGTS